MRKVTREEIVDFMTWDDRRPTERPRILAMKEPRRLTAGPITILVENVEGGEPVDSDLTLWADTFGLTHTVVRDPLGHTDTLGPSWPHLVLLDRNGPVVDQSLPIDGCRLRCLRERLRRAYSCGVAVSGLMVIPVKPCSWQLIWPT